MRPVLMLKTGAGVEIHRCLISPEDLFSGCQDADADVAGSGTDRKTAAGGQALGEQGAFFQCRQPHCGAGEGATGDAEAYCATMEGFCPLRNGLPFGRVGGALVSWPLFGFPLLAPSLERSRSHL